MVKQPQTEQIWCLVVFYMCKQLKSLLRKITLYQTHSRDFRLSFGYEKIFDKKNQQVELFSRGSSIAI